MLQQAGYKGEVIDLWTGDGIFTNDHALTEALAAMFEQVGMRTRITILEPSVYGVQFRDPKFPVAIIAAPSDQYFDPDGGLYRLLLPGV